MVRQGGQLQVIIGQKVPKLYDEVTGLVPGLAGGAVDEDPDGVKKEPFSWKKLPSKVLGAIVRCLTPILPIALCVLGPAGAVLGNYLATFLYWLHDVLGPVGVAIIGSLFMLIVATGMHLTLLATALVSLTTIGYDNTVLVGSTAGTYACIAIYLAYFLKSKNAREKQLGLTVLISQAFGGVGEPGMFGVLFRYPKLAIYEMVSAFIGGLWMGITNVKVYFLGSANLMAAVVFSGSNPSSLINGIIGCAIAFVIAFVLTFAFGWEGDVKLPLRRKGKKTSPEGVNGTAEIGAQEEVVETA